MLRLRAAWLVLVAALACIAAPRAASADDDATTAEARAEFERGSELAKKEDWAEALAAYLRSSQLRAHPMTTYNIAACRRVLGQYTHARKLFGEVLAPGSVDRLPRDIADNARAYKAELDRVVARVRVTLDPPEAAIAVDGRPLELAAEPNEAGLAVALAGVAASGPGQPPSAGTFELVLDPGTRVIVLSRRGYRDIVRNERFAPGRTTELGLALERLPATLRITSNVERAVVTVNGVDVGMAPVDVPRTAGTYRVIVARDGFVPHEMVVTVEPGEAPNVDAKLAKQTPSLTKQWWFWTSAAAVVAGGVLLTYAVTRPDAVPPDYQRGNTGWLAQP
jgi:hypothetical protein